MTLSHEYGIYINWFSPSVSLEGGQSTYEGRVIMTDGDLKYTVGVSQYEAADAVVFCRMAGFRYLKFIFNISTKLCYTHLSVFRLICGLPLCFCTSYFGCSEVRPTKPRCKVTFTGHKVIGSKGCQGCIP